VSDALRTTTEPPRAPGLGDFYVRGADHVQGDSELVFLDTAGAEVIGIGHGSFEMALERRARFLAAEAGSRAWRAHADGSFTPLPAWVEIEPRDVH
jgi:hypothetical protein